MQREEGGKIVAEKVSMSKFVKEAIDGKYKQSTIVKREDKGGYHGMILVVNAVSSTPPYVEEVAAGSPAAKLGMRPDDLILYVAGDSVPTIKVFRETMRQFGPSDEITIQFQRGNKLESVKMTLGQQPK